MKIQRSVSSVAANSHTKGEGQNVQRWGKECKTCNKPNHFAKCCKGSSNQNKIRTIENKEDSYPSSDSSENTSIYNVGTVNATGMTKDVERRPVRTVKIDSKDMDVLIDMGATANIMDEEKGEKYHAAISHR